MKVNVYSAIGSFACAAPAKDAAVNAINSSSEFSKELLKAKQLSEDSVTISSDAVKSLERDEKVSMIALDSYDNRLFRLLPKTQYVTASGELSDK